jgi:hypothetical protein
VAEGLRSGNWPFGGRLRRAISLLRGLPTSFRVLTTITTLFGSALLRLSQLVRYSDAREFEPFQALREQAGASAVMADCRDDRGSKNKWPLSGSRCRISRTCKASHGKPFRMSVSPVASHTRTPVGNGIIAAVTRPALRLLSSAPQCRPRP